MDIFTLITALIQATIGCTIVFFIFNFLRQKQKDIFNFEIKNLEAKMSNLRMILKAKVKKKSHFFRATAIIQIKQGDPFDLTACELAELAFENNEEFEKYFTLSKQLNKFLQLDQLKQKALEEKNSESDKNISNDKVDVEIRRKVSEVDSDFMTVDVKNEFIIIKTIHEMIALSVVLNEKIGHYNLSNLKNPKTPFSIIHFPSVADVQKIFSMHVPEIDTTKSAA